MLERRPRSLSHFDDDDEGHVQLSFSLTRRQSLQLYLYRFRAFLQHEFARSRRTKYPAMEDEEADQELGQRQRVRSIPLKQPIHRTEYVIDDLVSRAGRERL